METRAQHFGPPQGQQELAAVADIVAQAFAVPSQESTMWVEMAGPSNIRVLREEGAVAASALTIPMGQWFGGRRVSIAGIGTVGVAPQYRGKGVATRFMQLCLRELRGAGLPLSVLYPATQPLYRRVGFEQAGSRFEIRVRSHVLDFNERALTLRPVTAADQEALREAHRRYASLHHGHLDRSPYIWGRVLHPRKETAYGFLVERDSAVEGYVYLVRRRERDLRQEIFLTDFVALTPAAGRRLLSFLGEHRSLAEEVVWCGEPADPLLLLLPEQHYQVKLLFHWMVRVLDVPAALEARGYPAGVCGALHFEVQDELFPENQGRFILEVAGGQGHVYRGGEGLLRLNVRALASLYTGFLSSVRLRAAGLLEADDASVRMAAAFFSGPQPILPDMF